ncbi:MAG: hypothetical protein CM15mP12_1010 [Gammaproteobacteria bacterium]|nr:MAG: hypothetical protein CM15mP12_1010 [Gammaproteobacteria bacterium]
MKKSGKLKIIKRLKFDSGPEKSQKHTRVCKRETWKLMGVKEASIRFQKFSGLDLVGPKEMVSKIKFEELRNRFADKNIDQGEKLREHFTNLVYSKSPKKNKQDSADVKKRCLRRLRKLRLYCLKRLNYDSFC